MTGAKSPIADIRRLAPSGLQRAAKPDISFGANAPFTFFLAQPRKTEHNVGMLASDCSGIVRINYAGQRIEMRLDFDGKLRPNEVVEVGGQ